MLRTGVLVAVGVALALPSAALGAATVSKGNGDVVTFAGDAAGLADNVQITPDTNCANGNCYAFNRLGGDTISAGGGGCSGQNPTLCDLPVSLLRFDLAGGDDTVDLTALVVAGFDAPSDVNGGAGTDHLHGSPSVDTLTGGSGRDVLDGGAGDDTLNARDGEIDLTIDCGAGLHDTAVVDLDDPVTVGCESVDRPLRDDDGDGSAHGVDCNDANRAIHPGAQEIPNNGVDEDCSNGDLRADVDGDGALPPADCDDRNPRVHPGARDKPHNGVDENCDRKDADWRVNRTSIGTGWLAFTAYTQVTRLTFSDVPARGKVKVRCTGRKTGCPFAKRKLKVKKGKATATKLFKGARLEPGTVIEARIAAPDTMGKVVRYTIRSHALPKRKLLCLAPGAKKPRRCS